MKLTAIILLTASLHISARGVSQSLTINLKNATLEMVFSEIQRQTGYSFFYEDGLLKNARHVDVTVVKASIVQVLDICFANQPFTYKIVNNAVSIRRKEQVIQASTLTVPESNDPVTVSGKVTDESGQPLSGANVKVKGTTVGTTTDIQGRFTLTNLDANAILEVSFVGHDLQTFPIKGKNFLTIALVQRQSILDETVIIAYGSSSRRLTTGNIATVKAADIEKAPVQNPLLTIQGRVPGVEITQLTGMNGGGVNIRIQGINSRFSNNDPFIVVDGVPFPSQSVGITNSSNIEKIVQGGSPLNFINTNDIESIDILKDADATAIYGSRAANGAILITTKKGKAGKTRLVFKLQEGWGKVGHFVKMLNTRQYLDMRYEALRNDGIPLSTLIPSLTNSDLTVWDTSRYTNWQKTLLGGTAKYSNYNASISGGTAAIQYLVGATYNRQTVVFPGEFDDKVGNLHFNINGASSNQRFKVQLTGSYAYDQNHLPGFDLTNRAVLLEPDAPELYNEDGTLNWALNVSGRSTWNHPLANTLNSDFTNTTKNLVTNINLSYRIFPGLEFRTNAGYNNIQTDLYLPYRLEMYAPSDRINYERTAAFANRNMTSWIIEPQLQYTGKIKKGKIDGLLATNIQKNSYNYFQIRGSGFLTDLLMKTLRAATSNSIEQSLSGITRFNALFGRLGFNWDNKYLISLTARRDGSNKFGANNRFHNFGSVGVGWIFSDEKWFEKEFTAISFGKVRASYGTTGNDGVPDFGYLSIYLINNPTVLYQNSIGLVADNLPNPYLQWEETHKWQGGVDIGFLKDRILLGVTYSRNRSANQLYPLSMPTVTGFTSINKNLPDLIVQNINWEFTLNTINVRSKKISWSSSVNLTIPRNKVVSVPNLDYFNKAGNGQPLGYLTVAPYAGVNPANGNYLIKDVKGNPITSNPTTADKNIFLSNLSRYYGGIVNTIQYKDFQFDFLFQFVRKKGPRDMYYSNGGPLSPGRYALSSASNQPVSVLNRWQKAGDDALVGRFTTAEINNVYSVSDVWYSYEASYIRLKNVSLSWKVPAGWIKKSKLQNVRLYANGQNLATFTQYRGLDPETMSLTTLPPLRMITVGGQIEF